MPSQQVVYIFWRDIPAQFIVGKGRKAKKVKLPDRFEKAIDKCAMKLNFTDTDSYLKEWRKTTPILCEGSLEDIISKEIIANEEIILLLISDIYSTKISTNFVKFF